MGESRSEEERKVYVPPALVVHGDLRSLTAGGGGTKNEPGMGNPDTKA
jgi:hypothetical protein